MDLWDEIMTEQALLDRAVQELKPRGRKKAETEREYRMALSKRLTVLRAEGQPVTHLLDIAKGEEDIAKLRMERDIAESLYDSAVEAINAQKLKIRILEGQLSREWGNTKGKASEPRRVRYPRRSKRGYGREITSYASSVGVQEALWRILSREAITVRG